MMIPLSHFQLIYDSREKIMISPFKRQRTMPHRPRFPANKESIRNQYSQAGGYKEEAPHVVNPTTIAQ